MIDGKHPASPSIQSISGVYQDYNWDRLYIRHNCRKLVVAMPGDRSDLPIYNKFRLYLAPGVGSPNLRLTGRTVPFSIPVSGNRSQTPSITKVA
jgi:hypothetical protein